MRFPAATVACLGPRKPSVLYLTHHLPWPQLSGGSLREYQLLKLLSAEFVIDVVAVSRLRSAEVCLLGNDIPLRSVAVHLDESRRTTRRQRHSASAGRRLRAQASETDAPNVVHVEGSYLFHLVPPDFHRRTCLAEHNIESQVLSQFARLSGDRRVIKAARRVAQLEERAWAAAAAVITLTPEDQREVTSRTRRSDVWLAQNGSDHVSVRSPGQYLRPTLPTAAFLANYSYAPNQDALTWLLSDIWPAVMEGCRAAQLILAGSGMSTSQRRHASATANVEVAGEVSDVASILDRADVFIAPMRVGGGIKVKVLEALRRGCPVLTTSIGAQGLARPIVDAIRIHDDAVGLRTAAALMLSGRENDAELRRRTLEAGAMLPTWRQAASSVAGIWRRVGDGHNRDICHSV